MIIELEDCGDTHKRLIIGVRPLAYKYREGKMKRTLERELTNRAPFRGKVAHLFGFCTFGNLSGNFSNYLASVPSVILKVESTPSPPT